MYYAEYEYVVWTNTLSPVVANVLLGYVILISYPIFSILSSSYKTVGAVLHCKLSWSELISSSVNTTEYVNALVLNLLTGVAPS